MLAGDGLPYTRVIHEPFQSLRGAGGPQDFETFLVRSCSLPLDFMREFGTNGCNQCVLLKLFVSCLDKFITYNFYLLRRLEGLGFRVVCKGG